MQMLDDNMLTPALVGAGCAFEHTRSTFFLNEFRPTYRIFEYTTDAEHDTSKAELNRKTFGIKTK